MFKIEIQKKELIHLCLQINSFNVWWSILGERQKNARSTREAGAVNFVHKYLGLL